MISLETAKKLKEAGLKWKPKTGDWGYNAYRGLFLIHYPHQQYAIQSSYIYAPRLDQMLAEIEKRGYEWELGILTLNDGRTYMIDVALEELIKTESEEWKSFVADSPEEATAQVLLWILEQEVKP